MRRAGVYFLRLISIILCREEMHAANMAIALQAARDSARHPDFVEFAQRAETFRSSAVYHALTSKPAVKVLANAGLFLPDGSAIPACFHCGHHIPFHLLTGDASPVAVHQQLIQEAGVLCHIPRMRKRRMFSDHALV